MRKSCAFVAAVLLYGSLFSGCGSDGTSFATIQQALEECSQETMTNVMRALFAMLGVPDVIADEGAIPGFTVNATPSADIGDPPNTWDFSVIFDTNSNGIKDSAIVGKVTFSEDPTDGLSGGATVHYVFDIQNSPLVAGGSAENGTVTGSGDIIATLGGNPEQVQVTGTLSLADSAGAGCTADLAFTPLNLDLSASVPAQLAANVAGLELFGTIQAIIETLGHTLDAGLTLTNGDQTVNVLGTIDGTDVDFDFELLPSDAVIQQLIECGFFGFGALDFFEEVLNSIVQAIGGGTPPAGLIVTPTANPSVFNYTIDLAALEPGTFVAGTLSGQATLTFPTLTGITPSEVAFTWVFANAQRTDGVIVNGQNAAGRPFRMTLDGGGLPLALSGAGSLLVTTPVAMLTGATPQSCDIDFDIPENSPILLSGGSGGLAIFTVTSGADVGVLVFDFFNEETIVTINGIPFPIFF